MAVLPHSFTGSPRLQARFSPLGHRLDASVDHPRLLTALTAAFAGWEDEASEGARSVFVELHVDPSLQGATAPHIAAGEDLLRIEGGGVRAEANAGTRRGWARLSPAFLTEPEALRAQVIEPLALFLLTATDRAPLHAAGIVIDGDALLLAGRSGSGKSCLALAAASAGLRVLSDDIVYLQTTPALRAWGVPRPGHVYPDDLTAPSGAIRIRNGKIKHAVALPAPPRPWAPPIGLILLERGRHADLQAVTLADAQAGLARLEPGFALRRQGIARAIARVAERGLWRLSLSSDASEAIRLVMRNLDSIRARAAVC